MNIRYKGKNNRLKRKNTHLEDEFQLGSTLTQIKDQNVICSNKKRKN